MHHTHSTDGDPRAERSRADVDDDLAWACLHAAGLTGRMRAAIMEAGGAAAVRSTGRVRVPTRGQNAKDSHEVRVVASDAGERHVEALRTWIARGGRVLHSDEDLGLLAEQGPPLALYGRGAVALMRQAPRIAIVGARRCSARGAERARLIAASCAALGAVVVSGGAHGIDRAAHEGALAAGGSTIAVLGQPLRPRDDERPLWIASLFDAHPDSALSVTPFGPWVPQAPALFVSRNRYVAGLVDAVVVVEGEASSGTRQTAHDAQRLRVPVFAVPGDPDDLLAATPNALLLAGARAVLPGPSAAWHVLGLRPAESAVNADRREVVDDSAPRRRALSSLSSLSVTALVPDDPSDLGVDGERCPVAPLVGLLRARGGRVEFDVAAALLQIPTRELLSTAALLELEGELCRDGNELVLRARHGSHAPLRSPRHTPIGRT